MNANSLGFCELCKQFILFCILVQNDHLNFTIKETKRKGKIKSKFIILHPILHHPVL